MSKLGADVIDSAPEEDPIVNRPDAGKRKTSISSGLNFRIIKTLYGLLMIQTEFTKVKHYSQIDPKNFYIQFSFPVPPSNSVLKSLFNVVTMQ